MRRGVSLCAAALLSASAGVLFSGDLQAQCVPSPEICDTLDNDCDGLTDYYDNTLVKPLCEKQAGVCVGVKKSNILCSGGTWRVCTDAVYRAARPAYLNPDAVCDGVDSDCDGATDDDYPSTPTTCGTGRCASTGAIACVAGGVVDTCTPGAPWPDDSVVNFIDDDCDGQTDEDVGCSPIDSVDPTCDYVDDDCDGTFNEDYVATPGTSTCGVGGCTATGQLECVFGIITDVCTPGAPADEVCDGIDNDCDGKTDYFDNSLVKPLCEKQSGLCAGTVKANILCEGAVWRACTDLIYAAQRPAYANPDALCDGVDSDCDGVTDEEFAGTPTTCGTGRCASTGATTCVGGVPGDSCTPGDPWPDDTVVNFIDDDCDGQTDEDVVCVPIDTVDTTCDYVDDDCDGTFNEDYVPTASATTCGVGACFRTGQYQCVLGVVTDVCTAGTPTPEVCDAGLVDEDCDGKVNGADNTLQKPSCEKQQGVCEGTVKAAILCVAGSWTACTSTVYAAQRATYQVSDTLCNGLDGDCDGLTDEEFTSAPTTCGTGRCASTGATTCASGVPGDTCVPGEPWADDSVVNFIDDDCDGQTDEDATCSPIDTVDTTCDFVDDDCDGTFNEDYVPTAGSTTCGAGACQRTGTMQCVSGVVTEICTPGAPTTEVCDGLDNDCDSKTDGLDNSLVRPPCEKQAGVCAGSLHSSNLCVAGVWRACTTQVYVAFDAAYLAVETAVCDGRDNDCNGTTDAEYVVTPTSCGLGPCASTGALECQAGLEVDTCVPLPVLGADDDCNAVDDDCDGTPDNHYVPPASQCGTGACASTGVIECVDGVTNDTCVAGTPGPDDLTCNGIDDNCDAQTDEGCCRAHFTNLPATGYLNNSLCAVPGDDCASIDVDVTVNTTGVCSGLDGFELWVDGALVDVAPAIGTDGTFPARTFADGLAPSLVVRAVAGITELATSDPEVVTADLTDPVLAFTEVDVAGFLTPISGSTHGYGLPDDQNAGVAGIQVPLHVQITDANLDGGFLDPLTGDSGGGPVDLSVGSPALPLVLGASPVEQTVTDVTLPEGSATIAATAIDAAGNEATTTFQSGTDVTPPAAVALAALDAAEIDRRLPAVVLRWTAPGDDGDVGLATAYDIRFSHSPITDDASFAAACPVDDVTSLAPVAVPQDPGAAETLLLSGPDVRPSPSGANPDLCKFVTAGVATTTWFAVRAVDEVGNASPISAAEVVSTSELAVKTAQLTFAGTIAEARMDRLFTPLGDINGDGLADFSNYSSVLGTSCVLLGQNDGTAALDIPDLTFTNDASDTHQCFSGTGVGYLVAGLGDIDGDGVRDWALGYGGPTEHIDVLPGVTTGLPPISTAPYLRITGQSYSATNLGSQVYRVGDFDGDGLADIGVGSRRTNVFYIVLGNDALAPGDPLTTLDVTNEATYGSFRVVRVTVTGAAADSYFGMNAAWAGNMLPDAVEDGTPPEEVAIYMQNSPNQVFLLKGREVLTSPLDLTLSASATGTAANNNQVVRFFKENTAVEGLFGIDLSGGVDLDGGGVPDLVVGHYLQGLNHPELPYSVYVFYGETIQVKLGNNVKGAWLTTPPPAEVGEGVLVGAYGVILQGPYRRPAIVGDFDQAADGRADLVMHDLSASTWGSVWLRLNPADEALSLAAGTFPYVDVTVTSPYPGEPATAFGNTAFPLGDANGDGYPDLLVGTRNGGFPTIVY